MNERQFTSKVENWLHTQGIYKAGTHRQDKKIDQVGFYYVHWGGGMSASGIPDLICCINGKFVALELKGKGGRPSKLQEINIRDINNSGGIGLIPYPEDFEELKDKIRRLL